jgi:ABC transporter
MQDDLLNGNLTCEETLLYTARLRCPQDTSDAQRKLRVDRVLAEMGLEHARHTVVGTPMKKGISGGERKRLCVGIELLGDPKLLFLGMYMSTSFACVCMYEQQLYNMRYFSTAVTIFYYYFFTLFKFDVQNLVTKAISDGFTCMCLYVLKLACCSLQTLLTCTLTH